MDRNDSQAIEQLFTRLQEVEAKSPPRDAEAERFIDDRLRAQPGAAYYMAQTVVAQEQALERANERIEALERGSGGQGVDTASRPGLFGRDNQDRRGPWGGGGAQATGRGGGGFLAGAAQTALGVTGGVLLGSAIAGMFGADEAQAAEPAEPQPGADGGDAADAGVGADGGSLGDFGDW